MGSVRGVLLDMDGTLVDSNDAHARSWEKAFSEFGVDASYEEIRARIGKGGDKMVGEIAGWSYESPEGKRLSERRQEIFLKEYLPTIQAFPKAQELLARMHEAGLKLVIATSGKDVELKPLMFRCGADRYIEEKTTSDDAKESKPDPDIVHAALERIGLPADQVVLLGDTPFDIQAAGDAGVRTIALKSGGWGPDGLVGAIAIYEDAADLLAHFDESPLAG
ncbi:Phosphoglycolate phosphatase [Aquisphaera giovannonii]|uniref:Phosphoglycolate phosphatase n=1 Tax=Aquisphaera giovannonii TaxID=406548 RepID=A0A5B9W440_9BACT|nr:HAD family hydrolase [Aquisphaera giovannonii]QEH34865.1 Phosphoglycolate phosphatase [Aquisphaera giovannonii]